MHFPKEFEDETLYSLLSRVSIINGLSPNAFPLQISKSTNQRAADIEVDFTLLANSTNEAYGSKDLLIQKYLPKSDGEPLHYSCLIGLSNLNRHIWRWCRHCADEETKVLGISYWHKIHQVPCVVACEKHHSPLLEINIPFRERQSKFILPMHASKMNHYPACKDQYLNMAIAITHIERRLVGDKDLFIPELLESMFDPKLRSNNSPHNLKHTISAISNGQPLIESHIGNLLGGKQIQGEYFALLIQASYGGFDLFLNNYNWNQAMCNGTPIRPAIRSLGIRESHREACKTYIKNTECSTRTGFWKSNAKSAKWLSKYDSEWLNLKLPVLYQAIFQTRQTQLKLFNQCS